MIPDRITTARLTLRRATGSDLAAVHAMLSDPRAMRYWSTPPHDSLEQSVTWLHRMIARPLTESDDFLIEHAGQVIGKAGAWMLPEVGFLIHPDHWRQGFGTEALTALIPHLFTHHKIPHLIAEADPRNAASLALLASMGFTETQPYYANPAPDTRFFEFHLPSPQPQAKASACSR